MNHTQFRRVRECERKRKLSNALRARCSAIHSIELIHRIWPMWALCCWRIHQTFSCGCCCSCSCSSRIIFSFYIAYVKKKKYARSTSNVSVYIVRYAHRFDLINKITKVKTVMLEETGENFFVHVFFLSAKVFLFESVNCFLTVNFCTLRNA